MQMPPAEGRAPRYQHLLLQEDLLEGWTLVQESGYQGSPGRVKHSHHASWEQAAEALARERDKQIRRGYRVVFVEGLPTIP